MTLRTPRSRSDRSRLTALLLAFTLAASAVGPIQGTPTVAAETDPAALEFACPDPVPAGGFDDVDPGNVHTTSIECLVAYGITQGTEPGVYAPATSVTRAQMATFLVRLLRAAGDPVPVPVTSSFTDVDGVHADNITALAALGIAQGTDADRFAPGATVTRAQMATFLVRVLDHLDIALPTGGGTFDDVSSGDVHAPSIGRLAAAGVVTGRTARRYDPAGAVTRAQMASFLMRSNDLLAGEQLTHPPYVEQPIVIDDDTVVLDADQRDAIIEVEAQGTGDGGDAPGTAPGDPDDIGTAPDAIRIESSVLADELRVGDVVVSEPTGAAPDGLLVEVVAIEGDTVVTAPASLTDAVRSGSGGTSTRLGVDDLREETAEPGVTRTTTGGDPAATLADAQVRTSEDALLHLEFDDVEVAPGVLADGQLVIDLTHDIEVDIGYRRLVQPYLVRFETTSTLQQHAELELTAGGGHSFSRRQPLYQASFAPITFSIGPVPVVMVPKLAVELDANGEVSASVSYSVAQSTTASMGVRYLAASGWSPVTTWDAELTHTGQVEGLSGRADVAALLSPSLALYGRVDMALPLEVGATATMEPTASPPWSIGARAVVGARVGADLPLVGGLPGYDREILRRDWVLAEGTRVPATPHAAATRFYDAFLDRDAEAARSVTRATRPDAYDDILRRWGDEPSQQYLLDDVECSEATATSTPPVYCYFTTGLTPSDVMVLDRDGDGWVVAGVGLGDAYPHIWGATQPGEGVVDRCVTGEGPLAVRSSPSEQAAVLLEVPAGTCGVLAITEEWMAEDDAWSNVNVDGFVGFADRNRLTSPAGQRLDDATILRAVGCPTAPCLVERAVAYDHRFLGPLTVAFVTSDTYWGRLVAIDATGTVRWDLDDLGFSVGELFADALDHLFVGHSAGGSGYWMLALVPVSAGFAVTERGTQNYGGIWDSTGDGRAELHVSRDLPDFCHSCPPGAFEVYAWDGTAYVSTGLIDAGPWVEG